MNKKASSLSIIIWVSAVIVIILFLAGYIYFFNTLTTTLHSVNVTSNLFNFTDAVNKTFVPVNNGMSSLTWISFILIVTLAFAILLENFYIREHPVLFFIHVFVVILGIIAGIYISNYYEDLLGDITNPLNSTLLTFTASDYVVLYLPYWVAVIGIIGLVLLVINANRDPEIRRVGV